MAVGALRAAIKAGNWAQAAMQSRRQARALAGMNARGGIQSTGIRENVSPETLFDRGYRYGVVPPSRMEMAGLPLENNGLPFAYTTRNTPPSGRINYVNPETGARATFSPNVGLPRYGNPIEAPYEGMRVLPGLADAEGMTSLPPGPCQGRGQGPMWGLGRFSNLGGNPQSGLVSGLDELGEILYPSPIPMDPIFRNDSWYYPQFRSPDRSLPNFYRPTYSG